VSENKKIIYLIFSMMLAVAVYAASAAGGAGAKEEDICVDIYYPGEALEGTTLLPDNHVPGRPRVIEVDMQGIIVWEYILPSHLKRYTNPGFDVELLPNDNILLVLPGRGVYEIDRGGKIVWSYRDKKVSHDADRLPNGNTIVVFGNNDGADDAQVKEVNKRKKIVWSWCARDHFYKEPYKDIYEGGWTHANAVSRLSSGNTLISLRNFNFVVEVDPEGSVVRTIGEGILKHQHDPEMLPNDNMLVANHRRPQAAIEIEPGSNNIVWRYDMTEPGTWPVRDANRLSNGNTLVTGTTKIVEVTPEGKVVWQLALKDVYFRGRAAAGRGFYKAQRITR
jgi:hypothetical protein